MEIPVRLAGRAHCGLVQRARVCVAVGGRLAQLARLGYRVSSRALTYMYDVGRGWEVRVLAPCAPARLITAP